MVLAVVVVYLANPTHVVLVQLFELVVLLCSRFPWCSVMAAHELAEVPDVCVAEILARGFVFLDVVHELN